ncbi:serine/threonine-protein kinase [Paludisphaera mucosa]|uniref:Protein kinase n=1 Tax=Paludisphaera mucosa TaxID=3030827 RepID=A0ABT6FM18_9BACT|nr:serine/threonine-protein kinase [Paludisphaera mucosa]MDG3008428.1 protein kinase [Paludisphaera mucosa]
MAANAADRDLLFGLLALQNGLIDQVQLVAGFQAWTRDRGRTLAEHLASRGDLDADDRSVLEALVDRHLKKHGGGAQASLATVAPGGSTRESLAALGDAEVGAILARIRPAPDPAGDADRTSTCEFGVADGEGRRFRVLRPYARGGLGAVFVALDAELNREVALKQILERHADDPSSRQRFLLEAEITGGLEHPGIVPVYGLGTYEDGRPYYAMRFVRGDSLKEAIGRFHADAALAGDPGLRSLELRKLLRRFLDVCDAIEYAHSRGVLHRDIKPGNVIVGRHGETLVVDWGLAKTLGRVEPGVGSDERPLNPSSASGSAETLPGSALGTPAYMSPEQAAGDLERLGPRSDVYSLGATLYCLLTGRPPFDGEVVDVLRAVGRGDFPPPRKVDATVDAALDAVCSKAMALDPSGRYVSPRALAEDLERWIADEPVTAYRDPLATRVTRWGRRHRSLAASLGMSLASAVISLSIAVVAINRERSKAEANFRRARSAVDEYFTTVSENRLLNVPGLQPLRKRLLESARRYYLEFLAERGSDPSVRSDAASASFRAGWIDQAMGDLEGAMSAHRAATELYEQLARDGPDDVELRRSLARCHGAQGLALAGLGRIEQAIAEHRKALEIRRAVARRSPDDPSSRIDVARSHRNIGQLFRDVGKPSEAIAEWDDAAAIARPLLDLPLPHAAGPVDLTGRTSLSWIVREDLGSILLDRATALREAGRQDEARTSWDQARVLFEDLARDEPDDLGLRSRLADCYAEGHSLAYDQGRFEEAHRHILRCLELREAMAVANPSVPSYRRALSENLLSLAYVLALLKRRPEALAVYRRAADMAEGLLEEEPDAAYTKNLLAQGLKSQADLLVVAGRGAEALPLIRRSAAILEQVVREHPGQVFHASSLGGALRTLGRVEAALGDGAAALRTFERAAQVDGELADRYPGVRYNLACDIALMSAVAEPGREGLAADAVAQLRRAFVAGYANLENVKVDADLESLRGRVDFRGLELDMAFPRDPFAPEK